MIVYFPATINILTIGHIKCLRWLKQRYSGVMLGLLTSEALDGYKEEIVPFEERFEIMDMICNYMDIILVAQNSLDPSYNIKVLKPEAIASGDGWEEVELDAIKKYNLLKVDIDLPKDYSSSNIIKKIQNDNTTNIK